MQDLPQSRVDQISSILTCGSGEHLELQNLLSYSIKEVFQNLFEHSDSDTLYYCAQYWPKSEKVEFAVADFGVGIRKGLGQNPNFWFKTDKGAVKYSLLQSVSGKTHQPHRSENWFNSGYGLYMTTRLARNGGNFVVVSGNTAIHLTRQNKKTMLLLFQVQHYAWVLMFTRLVMFKPD